MTHTQSTGRIQPASRMGEATAYAPGGRRPHLDLFLDANEGVTPPADLIDALGRAGTEAIRRYPNARPLEAMIAQRFGLDPAQVIVTAGADDGLFRVCMAMLEPGREVILPTPTFEMLPRYAQLAGARVVPIPWVQPQFPLTGVLAGIGANTAAIVVVSPNNPTGAVAAPEDLRRLAEAAPQALLIVDLAYAEFAEVDLTAAALALPNAIVFRSFSKAWGLAGLRVGYAMGPAAMISWLRAAGNPFSVSGPALALVTERLARSGAAGATWAADLSGFINQVRSERGELACRLAGHGVETWPAHGNFVLARLRDALLFRDALAGLGIGVRAFPDRPEIADCVRITCPCHADNFARLCHAVDAALAPEALLVERSLAGDMPPSDAGGRPCLATDAGRPESIAHTLNAAGMSRAWLAAGTPQAVVAGRAAGVVPLGVARAGERGVAQAAALHEAGAARIVRSVFEAKECMP